MQGETENLEEFIWIMFEDINRNIQIGLANLSSIENGLVRIENCPKLCYVETVDWPKINDGKNVVFIPSGQKCDDRCPENCPSANHCWSGTECQKCLNNTLETCPFCDKYLDGETCVDECPKDKVIWLTRCLTRDECTSIPEKNMFIIDRECTNICPKYYQMTENSTTKKKECSSCNHTCEVHCMGTEVESRNVLGTLSPCTHIDGSLSISLNKHTNVTFEDLEANLDGIRVIMGGLRIFWTDQIKSLEFFKGLREIKGLAAHNPYKFVVTVIKNSDLMKLFDWDNFHIKLGPGNITFHDNPLLCRSEIEKFANRTGKMHSFHDIYVSQLSNGDRASCNIVDLHVEELNKNSTFITLKWDNVSSNYFTAYVVFYMKSSNYTCENLQFIGDSKDTCDNQNWQSILVTESNVNLTLTPYTAYIYYIQTSNKPNDTSSFGIYSQTEKKCFKTPADNPSPPLYVKLTSESYNSIDISWKRPEEPNGNLSHYLLLVTGQNYSRALIDERDYCKQGISPELISVGAALEEETNSTCECDPFELTSPALERLCYHDQEKHLRLGIHNSCQTYTTNIIKIFSNETQTTRRPEMARKVLAPSTKFKVENLHHFRPYIFYLAACNRDDENTTYCSDFIIKYMTTLRKDEADVIENVNVTTKDNNTYVEWFEPKSPNGHIVAYTIEFSHADGTVFKTNCITRLQHKKDEYTYRIKNPSPGEYRVRVQAESLAGKGKFTSPKPFNIKSSNNGIIIAIIVILFCVLTAVAIVFYTRYKKKKEMETMHLIARINPDYAGPTYIVDEWEMERSNVDVQKELGQGTFGMVYRGLIKNQSLPCAIKTVNENSNIHDRLEFLNEASVMKSFNDAHHVVRLLGVVSIGQPPLVVMELMERGDLKSYLRRSRESSHNITCAEMYRMAAEIADGMAYLAAKKFIHRDLAARNCMVSADYTVKIGDFGMARDIYETDYYRKESKGLLPVRWMAPESLADGVFTSDSDAWSYGVVLWEMVTLAEQPYQGLANEQVFQFVVARGVLDRPPDCPNLLYEIMQVCWKWRPYDRPLFTDVVDKLEKHIGQDFRLVSFYHSREGEEYRMNDRERVYNHPALSIPIQDEKFVLWKASDEDVSLYSGNGDRPAESLTYPHQRRSRPSSNYHLEGSSSQNGYNTCPLTSM